jgi:hypothetical protein
MTQINGKPFTDILGEIENGQILRDITEALCNVTHAVRETRKKGKITLTLELVPTGRGSVELHADFKAVEPEHDRPSTLFFITPDGTLVRDDPNQARLPLREVKVANNDPIKTVG